MARGTGPLLLLIALARYVTLTCAQRHREPYEKWEVHTFSSGAAKCICSVEDFAETPQFRYIPLSKDENTLWFAGKESFMAIDAHSGTTKWRKQYNDHQKYVSSPAVLVSPDEKWMYTASSTNNLHAVLESHDAHDGTLKWRATLDSMVMCFLPAISSDGNHLYLSASGLQGGMLKFKASDGEMLWNATVPLPGRFWGVPTLSPDERNIFVRVQYRKPNINKKKLVKEEIHALDTLSGETMWVFSDLDHVFVDSYIPTLSPDGTQLLAWSKDEHLYSIDVDTGKPLWRYHAGYRIHDIDFSPDGRTIYFTDDRGGLVHAMDFKTHKEKWRFRTTMSAWSLILSVTGHTKAGGLAVSSDGKTVFAGNSRGHTFAIDAETGEMIWAKDLEGGIKALVPAHSGKDGLLYIYDRRRITAVTEEQTFLADHIEL